MSTTGLEVVQGSQDWLDQKSWASVTCAGPIIAGIAWAGSTQLGIPSGWMMLAASAVFGAFVAMAHSKSPICMILALYMSSMLILFWQGALVSSAGAAAAEGVASALVQDVRAESIPWKVTKNADTYTVTSGSTTVTVPGPVYRAIAVYERRKSGWGVSFK